MPSGDDDDTGGHVHHKLQQVEQAAVDTGKKSVTLKVWVIAAIVIVAIVISALIF